MQAFLAEYEGVLEEEEETESKTLEQWTTSLTIEGHSYENEQFLTQLGKIDGLKTISVLDDQVVTHILT